MDSAQEIKNAIVDVPDFPKAGIIFKDITPVLADADLFRKAVELFVARHRGHGIRKVAVIEARGFLFGAAVALELGAGIAPIRKAGKLPRVHAQATYELEYGRATMEMCADSIAPGDKVILLDDLLATGGTAAAAIRLIRKLGGQVIEADFLIELAALRGRTPLADVPVFAPVVF